MKAHVATRPRIGRPPDSDAAGTRRRIIDAARRAFAAEGFAAATNRGIAMASGVTTGAVYHHFGSKEALYLAVYTDAHDQVYDRFLASVDGRATFLDMFDAVLDEAAKVNRRDPSLAAFIGSARVDRRRHQELAVVIPDDRARRSAFFGTLVDRGVTTGEVAADRAAEVAVVVDTLILGLNDGAMDSMKRQLTAIAAIKSAIRSLVHTNRRNGRTS
jgi:AcrR family transcriptional regulator